MRPRNGLSVNSSFPGTCPTLPVSVASVAPASPMMPGNAAAHSDRNAPTRPASGARMPGSGVRRPGKGPVARPPTRIDPPDRRPAPPAATRRLRLQLCLVTFCLLFNPSLTVAAETAEDYFRQGLAETRESDLESALSAFRSAQALGLDTPQLHYNLGVVLYRLGDLPAAESAFVSAAVADALRGPALYNLGRLAEARGEQERALQHYVAAAEQARTSEIRALARARVDALQPAPAASPWRGLLGAAIGYDSNPLLDADNRGGDDGAAYVDGLLWAEARLSGSDGPDIRGDVLVNLRHYPDERDAALQYADAGLSWRLQADAWTLRPGLRGSVVRFGGDTVETGGALGLDVERRLDVDWSAFGRAETARLRGGSDYRQLDGSRHMLRIGLRGGFDDWRLRLRYDLVVEDRDGLKLSDDAFESRSPLRHGVAIALERDLADRVWLDLQGGYRYSRYRERDRGVDGAAERRVDQRLMLASGLNVRLAEAWTGYLQARWTGNRSSVDDFDYVRSELTLGVDRSF